MNSARNRIAGLCAAFLVVACGGGGDAADGGTASRATAAGIWTGSAVDGRAASGVVLEDGSYYLVYSGAGANTVGGLLEGTATLGRDSFASTNGIDFNLEGRGPAPAPLDASFRGGLVIPATMQSAVGAPTSLSLDREPASWDRAGLDELAGSYEGNVAFALGVRPATFVVTASGAVSTVINGCTISGTVAPRSDINAFDLAVTFGGAPCVFPNVQFTGVAYRSADARLYAAVRHASRTQAIVFAGTKS